MAETNLNAKEEETMTLDKKLLMSAAPHIKSNQSTQRIMLDVIIALTPAMIGSIYYFKANAAILLLVSVLSAVVCEFLMQKMFKKDIKIKDLSAVVTGILLAFNLPANAPWWAAAFGGAFAIIIVKELFGGIGSNFMNPALAARAALVASWPSMMSEYVNPDLVVTATPLTLMKAGSMPPSVERMFMGDIAGSLGETSAVLLLIGAAYLLVKKIIDWRIPAAYIISTVAMLVILGVPAEMLIYHVLGGGLILGAFFMATDYATTPVNKKGRIIFGIGCGILTALIRVKGGMPEGVSYSILIMNTVAPLIERFTKPKVFGEVK